MLLNPSPKSFSDYQKDDLEYRRFLKKPNLLDYGHDSKDFSYVYNPDARIIQYFKASVPELPYPFVLAGHGNITRDSCGEFGGFKADKNDVLNTIVPIIKSCNQLKCSVCAMKACSIKAKAITQKYVDYIRYLFAHGFSMKELRPKHFSFNPNYVDKNGVVHINFVPDFSSPKNYDLSIKAFAKKYIEPYLEAGAWCYHHYRFADEEKTSLKVSGHFHAVAFGWMPDFFDYMAKNGFNYVNEGYKNHKEITSQSDIYRIWRYELSHVIFPVNKIIRISKRTHDEISDMARENSNRQLLGIESIVISEYKEAWSFHSACAYHYFGNMSPYKTRILKERKIKLPERDSRTNGKIYRIIDGYLMRSGPAGKKKVYLPNEAVDRRIKVDLDLEIMIFKSKLKFSKKACREKHFLRIIKIKNFESKPVQKTKILGVNLVGKI